MKMSDEGRRVGYLRKVEGRKNVGITFERQHKGFLLMFFERQHKKKDSRKKNSEKQKPGVRKINFYRLPPFLSDSAAEVKV